MNKRIKSLALVFVMVLSMLATAVPAMAAKSNEVTITPDKTVVAPGETVTYTVTVGPIEHLQSMDFRLSVPEALGYVSGKEVDGLRELLGADKAEYTDSTKAMVISGGGDYTSTGDTKIMTFTCQIPETTAPGDYKIALDGEPAVGNPDYEYILVTWNLDVSKVTVTGASKPATGISLNKRELTLTVGDVETLTATVTPTDTTDTVVWESSKDTVATVDSNGKVTAKAAGEAVITAKAGDQSATCKVTVEEAPCTHPNKTTVPEKASTCTDKGWDEYQTCDDCGKYLNMEGTIIEGIPYRDLDPNAHDYDTSKWGYKESDGHAHVCKHNPAHHDTVVAHTSSGSATETEAETCTVCGYVITPALGHVCANHLTKVDRVEATCTTDGNIEHYKCSCGKLYEDATGTSLTTEEAVKIAALGHDWATDWSSDETNHWHACTRCDARDGEAAHTWNEATCTDPKTCSVCGKTEGAALDHDWATDWSKDGTNHWHACSRCDAKKDEAAHNPGPEATETTPQTCTVCGYVINPATSHVCADNLTKAEAKAATCTTDGNKEHYKCSGDDGCGKLYEDAAAKKEITDPTSVTIPALGHDWKTDWSSDASGHWHACTRCSDKKDEAAHIPGAPATSTTPQTCTECGYVIAPATGGGSSSGGGGVSTYAIAVKDAKNGDVTSSRKSASKGTTVTLTVTPDKGYELDTIKVLDSKDKEIKLTEKDGKFTFAMPASKVTVEATFKAVALDNPFTDVPEGSYYEDAVIWAVDKGITSGTSATTFSPDGICTRAQAVTFLWRAAGSPAPKASAMPFADVAADSYYYDAVLWAVEKGITAGTSPTTFAPDLNCSRAQIVTFLWRANGSPAVSGNSDFADVAADAYYAKAVKWAQSNGITSGIGDGLFGSNDNCTRAQIVTFIYRYMEK